MRNDEKSKGRPDFREKEESERPRGEC